MPGPRIALGAACAALALTACGGSDTEPAAAPTKAPATAAPTTAPAKAPTTEDITAFITKAEAICARAQEESPDEDAEYTEVSQVQAAVNQTESSLSTAVEGFKALPFPNDSTGAGLRAVLVDGLGKNLAQIRSVKNDLDAAAARGDRAAFPAIAERLVALGGASPDKNGLLADSGLTTCDEAFGPNQE